MRITGGHLRSRAVLAPKGDATRPTTDRVREALFSALSSRGAIHEGARVLDLYAGSGALAFEALSRGAASAVLVESHREAASWIKKNADALGVARRITLLVMPVEKALGKLSAPFDLVLVDPPYVRVPTPELASELARACTMLATEGWLVLEHGKRDLPPNLIGFVWEEPRAYGDTHVSLARRAP